MAYVSRKSHKSLLYNYMCEESLFKISIGLKQVQICQHCFIYCLVLTLHQWKRDKCHIQWLHV